MPKLWTATIATHRREVRDAILETAAALVKERGLRGLTMSEIAEKAGIGRATLYKYFADVEAILMAWHERHVSTHLDHLDQLRHGRGDAGQRLAAVLETFALIQYQRGGSELAALLHREDHMAPAQQRLLDILRALLAEAAASGQIRRDAPPGELAGYCLHALAGASELPSEAAARRLAAITLDGLQPRT